MNGPTRVASADGELSALVWGAPVRGMETFVFLHPANLQGHCWEPVVDALGDAPALAGDLRGHGESTRRGPFGVAEWAVDTWRLIEGREAGAVHLVGASVGAAVAVALAAAHPREVRSVTTIGGAFLPADPEADELLAELRERDLDLGLGRELVDAALGDAPAALRDRALGDVSTNPGAVAADIWRAALATDVRPLLGRIEAPCLVLCGERDEVCPPADSRWFAERVGGELRVVPVAGHLLLYERPDLVAAAITAGMGASA